MIHKISHYKVQVSTGVPPQPASFGKLAGWGGSFLIVYRNNAGRLGAGFISVCLETRWLGPKRGFYVPGMLLYFSGYFYSRIRPAAIRNNRKINVKICLIGQIQFQSY